MKKILITIGITVLVIVVGGYIFVGINSVSDGSNYLPEKGVLDRIASLTVTEEGTLKRFGEAWVEKRGANYLLHLSGTPYEMGYEHGTLMREEIKNGTVPVFSDPISHNASFASEPKWVRLFLMKYLEVTVYGPIENNTPREYLEELRGIADGAGLDFKTVFVANFLSDLTMAMTPGVIEKKAGELGSVSECTGFAAAGGATPDGKLVFGRNTDYSGQGRWLPYQTIFFYKPKGGLGYVNIGTAGLIKCNSAMNEAGLVVSGHFMAFAGADPAGVSFTILENEIMRKARTLDEALTILDQAKRGGSFGLIVADGKKRDAAAVEVTGRRIGIMRMERGTVVLTNFATTEELVPDDLLLKYNLLLRNVVGRYERMRLLLSDNYGRISPGLAASFMSDHVDVVTGTERGTGITICSDNNVTSAVFLPEAGLFWVAGGGEPACANPYEGFDLGAELSGTPPKAAVPGLSGYRWADPAKKAAFELYMKAFDSYEADFSDKKTALGYLTEAIAKDPTEPIYPRMAAILDIHLGDYQDAIELLVGSLTLVQSPNEKAMAHLYLGWAYDLAGRRDEAVIHYREVIALGEANGTGPLAGINGFVYLMAKHRIEVPFTENDTKDIPIGFNLETGLE